MMMQRCSSASRGKRSSEANQLRSETDADLPLQGMLQVVDAEEDLCTLGVFLRSSGRLVQHGRGSVGRFRVLDVPE